MLKKISVADVKQGMYIDELCGSWMDHPFWKTGFLVSDPIDLNRLKQSAVTEVWIDVSKGLDLADSVNSEAPVDAEMRAEALLQAVTTGSQLEAVPLADEIQRALKICQRSKHAVMSMFSEVRMGKAIDVDAADELVSSMMRSIVRNPSALLSLVRLKNADEYTYMHSVAVSALMIALARQLNISEDLVQKAGLAGLMHDIGKMMIDDAILNKPGALTDEEFAKVRLHPVYGAKLLIDSKSVICPQVYDVCLHHHEKFDGTGYPKKLKGEQISLFARMAAVCDVYDAITSDRPYKKGWGPAESLQRMAQWQGHFDSDVFQAFVRTMGIYPVGSLVRLSSGNLAVVTEKNEQSLLKPKVKVFFSTKAKMPIEQKTIDLSKAYCTESIVARESAEDWGFRNLEDLWLA